MVSLVPCSLSRFGYWLLNNPEKITAGIVSCRVTDAALPRPRSKTDDLPKSWPPKRFGMLFA
jgi:hypothetical protein